MTDPTPRTAATARDALLDDIRLWTHPARRDVMEAQAPAKVDDLIALAAAEAPGRVAALVEELRPNCGKLRNLHGPLMGLGYAAALDDILAAPAAPAPTPSEPVGRCVRGVYAVHAGIPTVVSCGEPHDAEAHEQGAPDYDHPFTPATRDE